MLSIPMKQFSRTVVFVDTNPKNERIAVLKGSATLSQLDDDDTVTEMLRLSTKLLPPVPEMHACHCLIPTSP